MPQTVLEAAEVSTLRGRSRAFVQLAVARFLSGSTSGVAEVFRARHPRSLYAAEVDRVLRAAVPGGTTADANWASPLTAPEALFSGDFTAALRPSTVLGRLAYQPAPLHTKLPLFTTGAKPARWVTQGRGIPVTRATTASVSLPPYKIGLITSTTRELVQATSLDAVGLLEADLQAAIVEGRDLALLDPTLDQVDQERPASITNGCFTIPSTGSDPDAITTDAQAIVGHLIAAGSNLARAAFITSQAAGLRLGRLRDASGALAFPGAGPLGGTLLGLPLITSASAGAQLVVVDAAQLAVADVGIETSLSQAGALEMDTDPTMAADPPTTHTAALVPLFQTNIVGVRCLNYLSWAMLRPDAVAAVSGFPEATP